MKKASLFLFVVFVLATSGMAQDLALKGATILTITSGTIENGTVLIQDGKIKAVGQSVTIPAGVEVIDVTGKYVMPGLIDSHTHIALSMGDVNEATDPVTPEVWMKDILVPDHPTIMTTLAGGVTTVKTMHGSANVIGGVNVTIKLKYGATVKELVVDGVRQQLKMALGENPKRVYGSKNRTPSTRMGTAHVARKSFIEAQEYKTKWDKYEKDKAEGKEDLTPPEIDLQMETLKLTLEKKLSIDCHI